jgi:hypothetical protein
MDHLEPLDLENGSIAFLQPFLDLASVDLLHQFRQFGPRDLLKSLGGFQGLLLQPRPRELLFEIFLHNENIHFSRLTLLISIRLSFDRKTYCSVCLFSAT